MGRAGKGDGSIIKVENGYRGYITVNGKRKYFSAKTKTEAAQKKRELINRRENGVLVTGPTMSVAAWLRHWEAHLTGHLQPNYRDTNRGIIEKSIIPALGSKPLANLTTEHIEEWLLGLGLKPASQRRYLAPLRKALADAVDRGRLGFNPADRVKLAPLGRSAVDVLSLEDRRAVLQHVHGYNEARWHLGLTFGPRPGEALGLTWPDFDERAKTLRIRRELLYTPSRGLYMRNAAKTNAGTDRLWHLPDYLVEMLALQRSRQLHLMAEMGDEWLGWELDGEPVPLVFTQQNGRPIGTGTDTDEWHRVLAAAGLSKRRRYVARHTSATHLIESAGGDAAVVGDILGHASPEFTYRVYVHPLEAKKRALAEGMSAPYAAPYGDVSERSPAELGSSESPD